ncbi:MAG: hypothetical protein ACI35N_01565, partial [Marinilabiliaceae bacterium]
YGEFKLINKAITKTDYKGFKLEFSDLEVGDEGEVHLKIGKAVMDGDGNDKGKYSYVVLTGDKIEGTFSDALDDEIATLSVQCTKGGEAVKVTKFTLVKADETEEVQTQLGGVAWGCTSKQDVIGITFIGQYGYEKILAADGSAITYDPVAEKNVVYTYNIEFESALANSLLFEVDGVGDDGKDVAMNYNNATKGATSAKFEISADKCSAPVTNVYIKANAESGYPFTVKFKSVTRTKVVNRDKTIDESKNKYVLPLKNGQIILASDLEKFNDNDIVVFNYSCVWDDPFVSFSGWGMGSLRNPEDKEKSVVDIKAGAKSGDCQYVTFIDELKAIAGHHAPEETGENADTEEWDGIYYFSWNNKNGDVECVFTKGDIVVYTDKVVEIGTAIVEVPADADVVSTEFVSISGTVSSVPFRGLNVVKQTLADGSVRYTKALVK